MREKQVTSASPFTRIPKLRENGFPRRAFIANLVAGELQLTFVDRPSTLTVVEHEGECFLGPHLDLGSNNNVS